MAVSILPGAVAQILGASQWNAYNIVVYESASREIIVCDDLQFLQAISLTPSPQGELSAAFNSETGCIVVATGRALLIYEAIESFGRLPRWELAVQATDVAARSVAWLSQEVVVTATNDNKCLVWSMSELRTLWVEALLGPQSVREGLVVESFPESEAFATLDFSHLVKLWKKQGGKNLGSFDFVYLPHPAEVVECWFVSRLVLASVASGTLFLWRVASNSLIATIPLPPNVRRPLVLVPSPEHMLVQTASRKTWQLECKTDEDILYASEVGSRYDSLPNGASVVFTTACRLYVPVPEAKAIDLYDVIPQKLGSLTGVVRGKDPIISSYGNSVLAGRTVLSNQQVLYSVFGECKIVLNYLAADVALAITQDSELLCDKQDAQKWRNRLDARPLVLAAWGEAVLLVFAHKLVILNIETGEALLERMLEVEFASVYDSRLLVYAQKRLCLWNFSAASAEQVSEQDIKEEDLEVGMLELGSDIAAVLMHNDSTTVLRLYATAGSMVTALASIDLSSWSVSCMKWSQNADFLAVLTTQTVLIYATSRCEVLTQVGEASFCALNAVSLTWTKDLNIVLFNGQQLEYRKPVGDEVGRKVLADFGVSSEQASLRDIRSVVDSDMPIYHPKVLLAFVVALRPSLALIILDRLWKHLKFADTSSEGVALLSPTLGITAAELISPPSPLSAPSWPVEEFVDRLDRHRPQCVMKRDNILLQQLVRLLGDTRKTQHLDNYALAYQCLVLLGSDSVSQARVYAWFSNTKRELLNTVDSSNDSNLAFWLDREALADIVEQRAKARFAKDREPTEVTLPYVALRKMGVLLTLWRISSGHPEREKTLKFLANDFTNERWRLASHKNAYALLSKHRPEYAAAFFLLGGSVTDCCQVLVSKVNSLELAVTVSRLYDGDSGEGMRVLEERSFASNPWLRLWCAVLTNANKREVLDRFRAFTVLDPWAVFVYVDQGGQVDEEVKATWKKSLGSRGFSDLVCSALIDPLEQKSGATLSPRVGRDATYEAGSQSSDLKTHSEQDKEAARLEERPLPSHLKPAPAALQLEPDMSAFGF